MTEFRALISVLTRTGVTQEIKVKAFVGQVFASVGDIENINILSQLHLTFKFISFGRIIKTGNIPFSVTA